MTSAGWEFNKVELLPVRINDNLVIPIVSGGVMELAGRMAQ
jgi:dolichol kinase